MNESGSQDIELPPGTAVASYPWLTSGSTMPMVPGGGRPCLETSATVTLVNVVGDRITLPVVGSYTTEEGDERHRWELPSVTSRCEGMPCRQSLPLRLTERFGGSRTVVLELTGGFSRPDGREAGDDQAEATESTDLWDLCRRQAEVVTGQHIELLSDLYGYSGEYDDDSVTTGEGIQTMSWSRLMTEWRPKDLSRQPRRALIVRIAEELGPLLTDLCRRPRRILRRERAMERPERIRQLDPACIRWLVRQPGETHTERAGVKQQMMGVIRVEDIDTPENRVVRDFISLAQRACRSYLYENRRQPTADRVILVGRFFSRITRLLRTTDIGRVGLLAGYAEPNYVLLYDRRYHEVWRWYERLRRLKREADDAWRWRQRTWSEATLLAVGAALDQLADANQRANSDVRSSVYLRGEQLYGHLIDDRSPIGPWFIDLSGGTLQIDLLRSDQLKQAAASHPALKPLQSLCPDWVLLPHPCGQDALNACPVGVWPMFDFGLNKVRLQDATASLQTHLSVLPGIRGLLLLPAAPNGDLVVNDTTDQTEPSISESCHGLRLAVPLQDQINRLASSLKTLLPGENS